MPVVFAALVALLLGTTGPASAAELSILYSGNLNGELEPCGCSEESNLGGILRRATVIDRLRAERPDLVAISNGGLLDWTMTTDTIKNRFILKGFAELGYDAVGVQWQDLAAGNGHLVEAGLPWVASNWRHGDHATERLIQRGGTLITYFQWLDPTGSPEKTMKGDHLPILASTDRLAEDLAAARAAGALTVLGTALAPDEAARRLPLEFVDILLSPNGDEKYAEPKRIGSTLVLRPGTRGQRVAVLTVTTGVGPGGVGSAIEDWRHEVIKMPAEIAKADRLSGWYDAYNAALKVDYQKRVAAREAIDNGGSPFRGAAACKNCHETEHTAWNGSLHAGAHGKLVAAGKAFDPGCLGCHTVGFMEPGGFLDTALTGHLVGVQCESCHGSAGDHVDTEGQAPTPSKGAARSAMCAQCHNRAHSPAFAFEAYWPMVAHGINTDVGFARR